MKIKVLLTPIVLSTILAVVAGCSSTSNNLSWLNAIANYKLVSKQDGQVNDLYKKYSHLLTETEQLTAESTYEAIKKAGNKPSLETPVDYLVAKQLYLQVVPFYQKYKGDITAVDRLKITSIHEKLKSISTAIDKAIEQSVKDEKTIQYINTATLFISAFAK